MLLLHSFSPILSLLKSQGETIAWHTCHIPISSLATLSSLSLFLPPSPFLPIHNTTYLHMRECGTSQDGNYHVFSWSLLLSHAFLDVVICILHIFLHVPPSHPCLLVSSLHAVPPTSFSVPRVWLTPLSAWIFLPTPCIAGELPPVLDPNLNSFNPLMLLPSQGIQ